MYTEKEKEVYIMPHNNVGLDPLDVRRKLILESQGKLQELIDEFNSTAKALIENETSETELAAAKAEDVLVKVARVAFKLGSPSEGGVTDAIVIEYLAHFLEWLSTPLKPKPEQVPKSRPCTGCR